MSVSRMPVRRPRRARERERFAGGCELGGWCMIWTGRDGRECV